MIRSRGTGPGTNPRTTRVRGPRDVAGEIGHRQAPFASFTQLPGVHDLRVGQHHQPGAAAGLGMPGHVQGEDPDRLAQLRGGQPDAPGRYPHGLDQVDRYRNDFGIVRVDRCRGSRKHWIRCMDNRSDHRGSDRSKVGQRRRGEGVRPPRAQRQGRSGRPTAWRGQRPDPPRQPARRDRRRAASRGQ